MPAENDRELNLQRLAAENGRWADAQERLIETIRENKRQLERLPGIIKRLNEQLDAVTVEMNRTGAEHDALAGGDEEAAEFRAWADDEADDYSDFLLTTQPPRPNPFRLSKEPR